MSVKILLTGRTGQLGADLSFSLARLGSVISFDHSQLDLSNSRRIRETILEVHPQLIVNAAAYTAVDQAEKEKALAFAVNSEAPGVMAETAKEVGASLVHYSTDYVFDGRKPTPYVESDTPNPIRASGVPHLIFRCSWVYSTRGRNFLLTILRLATQREELRIVNDQIGSPTWSQEIALATSQVLAQLLSPNDTRLSMESFSGIYHMTAAGVTSWFDFAQAVVEKSASFDTNSGWLREATGGRLRTVRRILPITTAEYPTPAQRPAYSVLSNSRLFEVFGLRLPAWRVQLNSLFQKVALD